MKSVLLQYARPCPKRDYFKEVGYNHDLDMSVVRIGKGVVPFIEADELNLSVMTKTEAAREKDDTFPMLAVTETKTLAQREADDQGFINH